MIVKGVTLLYIRQRYLYPNMLDLGLGMFCISVVLLTVKPVSAHQFGCEALFVQEAGYEKVDPDDEISFFKPFTVRNDVQCCLYCVDNCPLCIGTLYNRKERKCRLLKRFLNVTNGAGDRVKDEWEYFRITEGMCSISLRMSGSISESLEVCVVSR
jgi:hypothetical protein